MMTHVSLLLLSPFPASLSGETEQSEHMRGIMGKEEEGILALDVLWSVCLVSKFTKDHFHLEWGCFSNTQ
jgi:hypothetical protein